MASGLHFSANASRLSVYNLSFLRFSAPNWKSFSVWAQINALLTKSISKPTSHQKKASRMQNVNMVLNALVRKLAVKRSHVHCTKNYSDHYIKKFNFSIITICHNKSARSYVCIFTQMVFITLDYQYNSGKKRAMHARIIICWSVPRHPCFDDEHVPYDDDAVVCKLSGLIGLDFG